MNLLNPLEVPLPFPVGDGLIKGGLFDLVEVGVMFDHIGAKGLLGKGAIGKEIGSVAQGLGYMGEILGRVDVTLEDRRRFNLVGNAIETRGQCPWPCQAKRNET